MNNDIQILLAEDDKNLGDLLKESLELNQYKVQLYRNGNEAWKEFQRDEFGLCLLDVMMPEKDGFTLAKEIRDVDPDVPIIFLTAKSLSEDKIEGFKLGADDYITKPFSMEELELRIEAVLRRSLKRLDLQTTETEFEVGKYLFDSNTRSLKANGNENRLTTKESDLLRLLCINKNHILDRNIALKQIWGNDNYFTGRSMDVYITKLRKYLSEDPSIEILNIHGKGFKLLVQSPI